MLNWFNSLKGYDELELPIDTLCADILGIVKGLRFYGKCDLAMSIFYWVHNRKDSDVLLNGSVVAVIINFLGKEGRVSTAVSLLDNLRKDGFGVDALAFTALIKCFC